MADLWRTRDRFGREVVLTEADWAHILGRRPRMIGQEAEVRLAVERADRVVHDADHADRENHYWRVSRRTFLKVVVAYDAAEIGVVITAHPSHKPKQREQQRWP